MDKIPNLPLYVVRAPSTPMTYPAAGSAPASVPSAASANTFGSWVQIVAATAADALLVQVLSMGANGSFTGDYGATQIGIGAAAAEVPIATVMSGQNQNTDATLATLPLPVRVPAGSRLSARYRWARANNTAYVIVVLIAVADLRSL